MVDHPTDFGGCPLNLFQFRANGNDLAPEFWEGPNKVSADQREAEVIYKKKI